MLPLPAVRAVHAILGGVEQVVAALAVPVQPTKPYWPTIAPAFKPARRAVHPYRPHRRHRDPFVFAR